MGNAVSLLWPEQTTEESREDASTGVGTPQNANDVTGTLNAGRRDLPSTTNIFITVQNPAATTTAMGEIRKKLSLGDSPTIQRDTYKRRTEGTGQWLLDMKEFVDWKNIRGQIFWATGIPGAGKTHLAACAINHVEDLARKSRNVSLAYAYFEYSKPTSILQVLESLVRQQAEWSTSAAKRVAAALARLENDGKTPSEEDYVTLLKETSDESDASFYFLDALDEAPPDIQFDTIELFSSINANLCIFSRPLDAMQARLKESLRDLVFVEVEAQGPDIELLVEQKIKRTPEFASLLRNDAAAKAELIRKIKQKAGGMFLHASLQIEALRHSISLSNMTAKIEQFPRGISGMYGVTLERIEAQPEDRPELAKTIITWLLYTREPLTVIDLQYALATFPQSETFDEHDIVPEAHCISVCCGLIKVDSEKRLRLIHATARDALRHLLSSFLPNPHTMIATTCMARLNVCKVPTSGGASNEYNIHSHFKEHPFLRYSYHHLPYHLQDSLKEPDARFLHSVLQFLRSCHRFPPFTYPELRETTFFIDFFTPLHVAAWFGIPILVHRLVTDDQLDVNARTLGMQQFTPLMLASLRGHEDVVTYLLDIPSIDANLTGPRGMTALTWTFKSGNIGITRRLLAFDGIDTARTDNAGRTPLIQAVVFQQLETVQLLLESNRVDVNATDRRGKTALMWSLQSGLRVTTKALLSTGDIRLDAKDKTGKTALMYASQFDEDVIPSLLNSVDINAVDDQGKTALIYASQSSLLIAARQLLMIEGIDVNTADNQGQTALIHASRFGTGEVVQILLSIDGIDVNVIDKHGRPAWTYASGHINSTALLALADHDGIDASIVDEEGANILMHVAQQGANAPVDIIHKLLDVHRVDINIADSKGKTALMHAATQHRGEHIVAVLVAASGIDVNAADHSGKTALMLAIEQNCALMYALGIWDPGVTRVLLATGGIDVNIADKTRMTALMYAAQAHNEALVWLLLEVEGINVNAVNRFGMSAHDMTSQTETGRIISSHPNFRRTVK